MSYDSSKMSALVFYFLIFVSFSSLGLAKEPVPLLIWGRSISLPSVPGLKEVSPVQLNDLLQHVTSDKKPLVAVFLADELSVEDFNLKSQDDELIFKSLSDLAQHNDVQYISSAINPMKAIHLLKESGYNWKHIRNNIPKDIDDPTVLVISLEDDESVSDRRAILSKWDSKIVKFSKSLQEKYPDMLAILTSKHNAWAEDVKRRVRREDAEEEEPGDLVFGKENIVVVASSIEYIDEKNSVISYTDPKDPTVTTGDGTVLLRVEFTQGTLNLNLSTSDDAYEWQVNTIKIDNGNDLVPTTYIGAPRAWSWFCPKNVTFAPANNRKATTNVLRIGGLQIQTNVENNEFGQAIDCIPYFSIGIWMGIFTAALLLIIMAWGVIMLMDINTNDRFDDPKGKTITISATD